MTKKYLVVEPHNHDVFEQFLRLHYPEFGNVTIEKLYNKKGKFYGFSIEPKNGKGKFTYALGNYDDVDPNNPEYPQVTLYPGMFDYVETWFGEKSEDLIIRWFTRRFNLVVKSANI